MTIAAYFKKHYNSHCCIYNFFFLNLQIMNVCYFPKGTRHRLKWNYECYLRALSVTHMLTHTSYCNFPNHAPLISIHYYSHIFSLFIFFNRLPNKDFFLYILRIVWNSVATGPNLIIDSHSCCDQLLLAIDAKQESSRSFHNHCHLYFWYQV